jgi:hypothetical protein
LLADPIFDAVKTPDLAGTLSYRIAIREGPLKSNPDLLHEEEVDELDDAALGKLRAEMLGIKLPEAEEWVW